MAPHHSMIAPLTRHIYRSAGLLLLLLSAAVIWQYWSATMSPTPCGGMGDCVKYSAMTQAVRDGRIQAIESPFNVRVLTPFLAAQLSSKSPQDAFRIVNAASLCIVLVSWFAAAKHLQIHPVFFLTGAAWFLVHPLGFTLYQHVPLSPDPAAHAAMALCAYLFISKRRALFWLTVGLGILIKESFVFLAMTAWIAEWLPEKNDEETKNATRYAFTCFALVFAFSKLSAYLIIKYQFPATDRVLNATTIMSWWWKQAWHDPNRFLVWIAATFCAMGVFPALIATWTGSIATLRRERVWLFLFLTSGGYVLFGLLAGADMSRIIFNGASMFLLLAFLPSKRITTTQACTVSSLSIASAIAYSYIMPSAIEYHYYDDHHHLGDLVVFAAIHAAGCLILYAWIRATGSNAPPTHQG